MSGKARGKPKPRGELAELQAQLQGLCMPGKRSSAELRSAKQEAFKKVINYMTLGMDMSGLFPMMTSCANLSPDDIVLKKMLYLYITHYAASTPDLVLLTINQLHKDCQDQDPTVRGLALRSLCSLRIPNLLEYVVSLGWVAGCPRGWWSQAGSQWLSSSCCKEPAADRARTAVGRKRYDSPALAGLPETAGSPARLRAPLAPSAVWHCCCRCCCRCRRSQQDWTTGTPTCAGQQSWVCSKFGT